ncbi:nucleolar protein 10 [Teleopsis dalmanni]|uniref:nucleolar protein 10 n=1 Tax=Teleopsis dalmanni TaxID=139649 RepID=UPI0018CD8E48|nr:nucleolar protein 10 [Teleopsis dalmanni]
MFVNEVNDVKIYNLSAGKSVPDWLTDRRKRSQLMKKVDSRRQIELIQDFDMPVVCTSIRMSPDQQHILATGTYKPRVKCFEVCNLSIKFERCFDSEVVTFESINEDYSKLIFLQCDRFIEIHSASGRHFRIRIPRFGRDMKYHKPSCDLYIVGTTRDIYRLNLERGQFLQPFETEASCLNACEVNPEHHLLVVGSKEGTVEAWDPRTKARCATLDVAIKLSASKTFPSISAISFKNALQMGVGTASGHVLLYDIRSKEPLLIKDHLNKLPIKRIAFNPNHQTVYTLDSAMLKLWDETTGKPTAYIESTSEFNDFCTIPSTGMFFLAQEDVKMLTYYVPAMGPAPRWCSFLDNLTEEIESEVVENLYDDYQFITQKELEELGLEHLIGTNLLKAYMHGYFIDVRLYNRAKAVVEPFAFDRFRKEKIRQEIENERKSRLQIQSKLPKVNQELALKLIDEQSKTKTGTVKKAKQTPNLLEDTRFKAMFENTDFAINKNAEEYKMLAPVLNRLDKSKLKELKKRIEVAPAADLQADEAKAHEDSDNDEDLFGLDSFNNERDSSDEDASSDEEYNKEFAKDMKKAYKDVKKQRAAEAEVEEELNAVNAMETETNGTVSTRMPHINETKKSIKMIPLSNKFEVNADRLQRKAMKISLGERVRRVQELNSNITDVGSSFGNRQMAFETKKVNRDQKKRELQMKKHHEERKKLVRPIQSLKLKKVNFK